MQDPKIIDNSNLSSPLKNILLVLAIAGIFVSTAGLSFYVGRKTKELEAQPTPPPSFPNIAGTSNSSASTSPTSAPINARVSSPTQTPIPKSIIIQAKPELDGYQFSNGTGSISRGIRIGRNERLVSRGFLSFSLDELPAGANVQEATLRIYQTNIQGSPFSAGEGLQVDHLTYGDSLDSTDYAVPALLSNFERLPTSPETGWKEVDVTNRIRDDLSNARSFSQFRIHFEREVTDGDDFVNFESADNYQRSGNLPQIVIKYY